MEQEKDSNRYAAQNQAQRSLWEKMHSHIQDQCLLSGKDFKLSAGGSSSFYFDCKKATLNGDFLLWMSDYILQVIGPRLAEPIDAAGGMTLGADFMTAALVMRAAEQGLALREGCIVRKEPKQHGTRSRIENELDNKPRILVIDDVITSGASIGIACREFQQSGYRVVALLTLIDRQAGGVENLKKGFDLPVISVFRASDFTLPTK